MAISYSSCEINDQLIWQYIIPLQTLHSVTVIAHSECVKSSSFGHRLSHLIFGTFGNRRCPSATDFVVRQASQQAVLDRDSDRDLVRQESIKMATLTSRFQNALRDILRQLANGELDEDGVDSLVFRLEQLGLHVLRLCDVSLMDNRIEHLITNTITLLRNYNDQNNQAVSFQSVKRFSGEPGCPSFNISSEQLQYLLHYDLSVPDIAVVDD